MRSQSSEMPRISPSLILQLISFWTVLASALTSSDCTFPDGTTQPGYVPCNTNATISQCCLSGEVCLQNGLCYGGLGLTYRGGCAGGWGKNETACPTLCSGVPKTKWVNMYACSDNYWWCGSNTVCNETTDSTNFRYNNLSSYGSFAFEALAGSNSSSDRVGGYLSTNDTNNNSSVDQSGTTNVLGVGLGLGLGLGVLLLAAIAWAIWERRRAGKIYQSLKSEASPERSQQKPWQLHFDDRRAGYGHGLVELGTEREVPELGGMGVGK